MSENTSQAIVTYKPMMEIIESRSGKSMHERVALIHSKQSLSSRIKSSSQHIRDIMGLTLETERFFVLPSTVAMFGYVKPKLALQLVSQSFESFILYLTKMLRNQIVGVSRSSKEYSQTISVLSILTNSYSDIIKHAQKASQDKGTLELEGKIASLSYELEKSKGIVAKLTERVNLENNIDKILSDNANEVRLLNEQCENLMNNCTTWESRYLRQERDLSAKIQELRAINAGLVKEEESREKEFERRCRPYKEKIQMLEQRVIEDESSMSFKLTDLLKEEISALKAQLANVNYISIKDTKDFFPYIIKEEESGSSSKQEIDQAKSELEQAFKEPLKQVAAAQSIPENPYKKEDTKDKKYYMDLIIEWAGVSGSQVDDFKNVLGDYITVAITSSVSICSAKAVSIINAHLWAKQLAEDFLN
jgi:hypothetical protein